MLFLGLAVACSIAIATLFNAAERRQLDRAALLTVNYAAALVLAVALQGAQPISGVTGPLLLLSVGQGILFIGGFWVFSLAIRRAGMGLAAGVMRLSVVIPVLASWAIWSERPSVMQGVGLALGGLAFFLVARPGSPARRNAEASSRAVWTTGVLGLLFLAGGAVDLLNKVFAVRFSDTVSTSTFLLFVFGVAFAMGVVLMVVRGMQTGEWPRGAVLGWGAVVGVVNYASADLFLRAVDALPAPFVFPANSIAVMLGAALVGWVVWQERISRVNALGLAMAGAALILLAR
ncbi:MAG: EamA family transporter [Bacteroidota bacterium]